MLPSGHLGSTGRYMLVSLNCIDFLQIVFSFIFWHFKWTFQHFDILRSWVLKSLEIFTWLLRLDHLRHGLGLDPVDPLGPLGPCGSAGFQVQCFILWGVEGYWFTLFFIFVIFRNGLLLENISVKLFCFIFVNSTRRILRQLTLGVPLSSALLCPSVKMMYLWYIRLYPCEMQW